MSAKRSSVEREPLGWRLVVTDAVVLAAVSMLALSPLADAYRPRWIVAATGGLIIGLGVTLAARALRWGPLLTALLLVVVYLVAGPALAAPDRAVGGVLPGPSAVHDLLTGTIDGWRNALTLEPMLGSAYQVLIVPFVAALAGALFSSTFLWRSRWPSVAALGPVAMFVAAAAFGTRATDLPWVRGLILAIGLIVWIRWRALRAVRTTWTRRIALTGAVVAVASVVGWGGNAVLTGGEERQVARDHVEPPLDRLDFKSPLSKYRHYYLDQEDDTLFRIDGLPEGAQVRLATMDAFDGIVWNVSTVDARTGSGAFDRASAATGSDAITVTIEDYEGPWIPTIGHADGVSVADADGRDIVHNDDTGAAAIIGDVRKGDVFTIDWSPLKEGDGTAEGASTDHSALSVAPSTKLPQLDKLTQTWVAQAGASGDYDVASAITTQFLDGFFSDGRPDDKFQVPAGHGAKRIANLIADPDRMIGNEEQYASALGLELQTLGMPARVVLGFPEGTGPEFTGDDITAWVEVKFSGAGWVAFDPTPDEDRQPAVLQEDPNPQPQQNVVQPPVLPREPDSVDSTPPESAGKNLSDQIWDVIWMILGIVWTLLKIIVLLSPIWGLLLVKSIRRKRRRKAEDPIDRMSGGWREVTDRARDLGTRLPRSQTRYESSVVLAEKFPGVELPPLATVADRHVFGPVAPTPDEVDAYWADVETALRRMRKAVPWWRRPLAWLSPASIPWGTVRDGAVTRLKGWGRRLAALGEGITQKVARRRGRGKE